MARISKAKKTSRPKNRKKSNNRRRPLIPALYFLVIVSSLIAILYFYTDNNNTSVLHHPGKSAIEPDHKDTPGDHVNQRKLLPPPPPSVMTTLQYNRLGQNFSQVTTLKKSFHRALNRQQKAHEIIRLLTLTRTQDLAPLPQLTRLLDASFRAPLITIDLSSDLVKGAVNFGGQDEMLAISCLTNSFLANFPGFTALQILIEGEKRKTLAGHIDISQPLH